MNQILVEKEMAACIGTSANFMHDPMYCNAYHILIKVVEAYDEALNAIALYQSVTPYCSLAIPTRHASIKLLHAAESNP